MRVDGFEILEPLLIDPLNVIDNLNIVSNLIVNDTAIINYKVMCKLHLVVMAQPAVVLVSTQVV